MRAFRLAFYALLFAAGLALYAATLHTDVQAADSGELQLVALRLGVAHPPGYPLFSVLGWLFSWLPFGTPYARVSFLSAVASAGTLAMLALTIETALSSRAIGRAIMALACGAGALALATSTTFWAQATTTNIRSVTAFFMAGLLLAAARASVGRTSLRLFAVIAGLGVAHHASLIFSAAVIGLYILAKQPVLLREPGWLRRELWVAAAILLATQFVWLYLPARGAAGAPLAPDNLTTLNGFLDHVLARGFGGDMLYFARVEPERFWDRMALLPNLLSFQFSVPLLALMAVTTLLAAWRVREYSFVLLAAFVLHMFITLTYRAPQTVEYAMPCWVMACALLGVGVGVLGAGEKMQVDSRRRAVSQLLSVALSLVSVTLALADGVARAPDFVTASRDRSVRADAEAVLRAAMPESTVLAQWHQATPMWVLQQIEGRRADVAVDYVSPNGAQPYGETFAERALALSRTASGGYITSLFAEEFLARRLQANPVDAAPAWRVSQSLKPVLSDVAGLFDGRLNIGRPVGLDGGTFEVGQSIPFDIRWISGVGPRDGDAITVRILRHDGRLAATADTRITVVDGQFGFGARRQLLTLPLDLEPGVYPVLVGAYRVDASGFAQFKDARAAEFVAAGTITVTPASQPPATQRPMNTPCVLNCAGPLLIGADYDLGVPSRVRLWTHFALDDGPLPVVVTLADGTPIAAARSLPAGPGRYASLAFDIPPERNLRLRVGERVLILPDYADGERYVPFGNQMALIGLRPQISLGNTKVILTWLGARPITSDYIVSVRLSGERFRGAHDSVPALGAIPTLKWLRHSRVIDNHPFDTDDSAPGPFAGSVVVYDSATRLLLPVLDERYERGFVFDIP